MDRRQFLGASAAIAAAPSIAQSQSARVLKMVPHANLTVMDPVWTTAYITRNHGFMVWDTLYGLDAEYRPQPQMVEGHTVENDGKLWTFTLREGLRFHNGEPVRAADCVASLARWARRDAMGTRLAALTEEMVALDDRRFTIRLSRPFGLMLDSLAKPTSNAPFIMPASIAATDAFTQIRPEQVIGSGPFSFKRDELVSGSRVVYERFAGYRPRQGGTPSGTAGPKVVHFDRVEWHIIVDAATSAAALQTGEIDWYEQPPPEIQMLLRRNRNVKLEAIDPLPLTGILRFNHLHPPFDNKRLRQAILPAINQADFMSAVVGTNAADYRTGVGFFTPGTPLANDAAMGPLTGPRSVDRARALMREAGYTNQLMRLIGPTDILAPSAMTQVGADLVRRLGFNADIVLTDWGSTVQRRTSREPVERGGWSMLFTAFSSFDFANPAAHFPLRGNGTNAWFGWPTIPRLEELRDAWFDAPDLATEQRLAREMQVVAMDELPYIPVGAYMSITALRGNLNGRVGGLALFWGIQRS
jgi:peptide/nickel transport system substrate-binding protein